MKRKLSAKEYTYVASMLFGLFFGAGNLIFPVHLGQMAGSASAARRDFSTSAAKSVAPMRCFSPARCI